MNDIYFSEIYGKLYEKMENGKCETFTFKNDLGLVRHLFIKRKIPISMRNGTTYYDLITPYGYGGPVLQVVEGADEKVLVKGFLEAFQKYCDNEAIVSEFIRFHPVLGNVDAFKEFYNTTFMRKTVQTRLKATEDPLLSEYSPSIRKFIRKALNRGVEYHVIEKPNSLEAFRDLYLQTLNRNKAADYYYFDKEYFDQCLELLHKQLIVVEVRWQQILIAMSLNFVSDGLLHVHLTGSLEEYHDLYAPNILQYALLQWGLENDIRVIHHGGGRTNEPDDKLYLYKKKYGRAEELEFYVAKQIWNREIYDLLCEEAKVESENSFFPAYRKNLGVKEQNN